MCTVILTRSLQVHYVFDPGDVGEDLQVKKLAFDLRNIEMVMAGVLTPEKLRYSTCTSNVIFTNPAPPQVPI